MIKLFFFVIFVFKKKRIRGSSGIGDIAGKISLANTENRFATPFMLIVLRVKQNMFGEFNGGDTTKNLTRQIFDRIQ